MIGQPGDERRCNDPEHGLVTRSNYVGRRDAQYVSGHSVGVDGDVCKVCYCRRWSRMQRAAGVRKREKVRPRAAPAPEPEIPAARPPAENRSTRPAPDRFRGKRTLERMTPGEACKVILACWGTPRAALLFTKESATWEE